jgi:hypothetical protein
VLAPGGEPLAGRSVVTRLSSLLARHRDKIMDTEVDVIPAWGAAYRASTMFANWDLNALVNEARSKAAARGVARTS